MPARPFPGPNDLPSGVINLASGEPGLPVPDGVLSTVSREIPRMSPGYVSAAGTPSLRQGIIEKFSRENGVFVDESEILVGCGSKQIIFHAFLSTIRQGDEVVLVAPYFPPYKAMIESLSGRPVIVRTRQEDRWKLSPQALSEALSRNTRWVVLNSPSNPAGTSYTPAEAAALAEVVLDQSDALILSDEVYEHIQFGVPRSTGLVAACPDARPRTVTVNSISKTYAMTGWRLGFGFTSADLARRIRRQQAISTTCAPAPSQLAAQVAFGVETAVLDARRDTYRQLLVEATRLLDEKLPELSYVRPDGALYVLMQLPDGLATGDGAGEEAVDVQVCRHLLQDHQVYVVPGTFYGAGPGFRINYTLPERQFSEAIERVAAGLASVTRRGLTVGTV